jgi:peptide/nickel transport system permease protein
LIGVFLLLQFAPGDTVDAMMAQMGGGDAATAKELRRFYGLDLSVAAQLVNYLWRLSASISASRRSTASRW